MNLRKGDRVRVNLAPFIGLSTRCGESVACEVLGVDGLQVHVCTLPPCRFVSLWVTGDWIEERIGEDRRELVAGGAGALADV